MSNGCQEAPLIETDKGKDSTTNPIPRDIKTFRGSAATLMIMLSIFNRLPEDKRSTVAIGPLQCRIVSNIYGQP